MPKKPRRRPKMVFVPITPRQWRGLQFEARLMNEVFGGNITPAAIARNAIDRRLGAR